MKIGNSHLPPVTPASAKAVKTTGLTCSCELMTKKLLN